MHSSWHSPAHKEYFETVMPNLCLKTRTLTLRPLQRLICVLPTYLKDFK